MIDISDPPPSKKRDRQRDKRERERERERNQTWERGGRANKNIRMVLREGR